MGNLATDAQGHAFRADLRALSGMQPSLTPVFPGMLWRISKVCLDVLTVKSAAAMQFPVVLGILQPDCMLLGALLSGEEWSVALNPMGPLSGPMGLRAKHGCAKI